MKHFGVHVFAFGGTLACLGGVNLGWFGTVATFAAICLILYGASLIEQTEQSEQSEKDT